MHEENYKAKTEKSAFYKNLDRLIENVCYLNLNDNSFNQELFDSLSQVTTYIQNNNNVDSVVDLFFENINNDKFIENFTKLIDKFLTYK